MLDDFIGKLKCFFGRHDWENRQVFICNPDAEPNEKLSSIKKGWFYEVREYMESIGLDGLLPYYFRECKKCGKQTIPAIDTLVKATIVNWYFPGFPESYDISDIKGNYPVEMMGC